jgi:hypothetical protein
VQQRRTTVEAANEMQQSIADALSRLPLSRGFAETVARMHATASQLGHRQVSLEHLLLALTDDAEASLILQSSGVEFSRLVTEVSGLLSANVDRFAPGEPAQPGIGPDVVRILEYSMAAARQSKRGREINGAIVLAAIVGDGKSPSAHLLQNVGFTFDAAIKALQRSLAPAAPAPRPLPQSEAAASPLAPVAPPPPALPPPPAPIVAGPAAAPPIMKAPEARPVARDLPPAAPPMPVPPTDDRMPPMPAIPVTYEPPTAPAATALQQVPQAQNTTEDILASVRRRIGAGRAQSGKTIPPLPSLLTPGSPALDHPQQVATPQPPGPDEIPVETWQTGAPVAHAAPPPLPPSHAVVQQAVPKLVALEISAGLAAAREMPDLDALLATPTGVRSAVPALPPLVPTTEIAPEDTTRMMAPWPEVVPPRPAMEPPPYAITLPTAGETPRPPAHPGRPTLDLSGLREVLPRSVTTGKSGQVEARIVKADLRVLARALDGPAVAYEHASVVGKALTVRLKSTDQACHVEARSPETLWIESAGTVARDDVASWTWAVTPKRRGRIDLALTVSARTIGPDGFPAETVLPDRPLTFTAKADLRALALRAGWTFTLLLAGAALAHWSGPILKAISAPF